LVLGAPAIGALEPEFSASALQARTTAVGRAISKMAEAFMGTSRVARAETENAKTNGR
jgi:hypothetical protein